MLLPKVRRRGGGSFNFIPSCAEKFVNRDAPEFLLIKWTFSRGPLGEGNINTVIQGRTRVIGHRFGEIGQSLDPNRLLLSDLQKPY